MSNTLNQIRKGVIIMSDRITELEAELAAALAANQRLEKERDEQFAISTELARMLKNDDSSGFQTLCSILSEKNLGLANERRELRVALESIIAERDRLMADVVRLNERLAKYEPLGISKDAK